MGLHTKDFIETAKSLQKQTMAQPRGADEIVELNIKTRLVRNLVVEASFRDHVWQSDEPKERGGGGSAPGPLAHFLGAVGCGIITQCSYEAASRDVEIDEIGIAVKAPLRRSPGSSIEAISYETSVKSNASAETIEDIVRNAVRKSFITNTLRKAARVTGRIILNGQQLPTVLE